MNRPILLAFSLVVLLAGCGEEEAVKPVVATPPPPAPATPVAHAAAANGPLWLTDVAEAKRQAATRGVPILADFTGSDWCQPCQLLRKEVFDTPEFAAWAAKRVVLLELDFPHRIAQSDELKAQNQALFEHYKLDAYPTILFLDAAGTRHGELSYLQGGAATWIAAAEGQLAKQ